MAGSATVPPLLLTVTHCKSFQSRRTQSADFFEIFFVFKSLVHATVFFFKTFKFQKGTSIKFLLCAFSITYN